MKTMIRYGMASVFLGLLAVQTPVKADTLINNFTTSANYVAGGIINETNWDGVYLNGGDIFLGAGAGTTTRANETDVSGYLTTQGSTGNWAGGSPGTDSSFFLYKVVAGDFDVSVDVGAPFLNPNYHLPGVMARLYNPNNSGSPYSITTTNASENWIYNSRWEEFGGDIHGRFVTNNVDHDGYCSGQPSDSSDISTADRYLRITRVGDTFTLYEKTNILDAWFMITNSVRTFPEWHGLPMQVGIHDESGTANTPLTYFSNFQLSGTNVTFPVMPPHSSALVTTATNTSGSLTFSWTRGAVGDSSLVVMSQSPRNIQHNPVNGMIYNATNVFGNNSALLDGAGEYVIYNGAGNSVTVTNLGGNNLTYNVAVFEYTNNGSSTIYNTVKAVTNNFVGPGVVTGVVGSMIATNIPVGGADLGTLFATFSSGGGTVDESASAQTVWTSSDPTIASISGRVLTGVASGTVTVIGTFNGTFSVTNMVTVHGPVFTDNFSQNQDYVANGLMGSTWDGLFLNFGDVPNANKGGDNVAGSTSRLNANISSNNVLTVEAAGSSWYTTGDDGPYLFKVVTGDFEASVHVGTSSTINNFDAGIMARLYDNTGGATEGGGGGAGGAETHINWVKVQNGTPAVRRTIDGGGTTTVAGLSAADGWLLMQRVSSTNFYMYESSNPSNGWTYVTTLVVAEATNNAPMEVGIEQEMRTASDGAGQLDHMMIDGPGIVSPNATQPPPAATNLTVTLNADLSMTFSWVATNSAGSPVASILVMRAGGPVTAQPTYGLAPGYGGAFGTGLNLGGGNYVVARSSSSPTTVTVTGLSPGVRYYAAVFTFAGAYPDRVYNNVLPPVGATAIQQDGSLQSLSVLPLAPIPRGGIGQLQVLGIFGGSPVNVSQFATLTSANTNIVVITNGVLTGLANGSTTVTVIYSGYTNTASVTVRDPGFTDSYTNSQDYLNNGVAGTPYDGLYNPNSGGVQIPESTYAPLTFSGAAVADASITSNGVFTISSAGDGWENDAAGGFFLFKYVPGDFQMAVHIHTFDVLAYNQPGILARAYSTGTNRTDLGSPFVLGITTNFNGVVETNSGESWVDLSRFDEYGIGTYARLNTDGAVVESTQPDSGDGDFWLLIVRSQGVNFNFYKRATNTAPWQLLPLQTSYQVPEFAGVPMQVGLMAGPWDGTSGTALNVQYDYFMLDAAPLTLQVSSSGGNVNLSWPAIPGVALQQTPSLRSANWQPVPWTLTTNAESFSISIPMTNAATFFRLVH